MSDTAYTDPRYGMIHTHSFPTALSLSNSATGVGGDASRTNLFRLPFKAKLVKFGIIPVTRYGTNIMGTSLPVFGLRLEAPEGGGATVLATFNPSTGVELATLTQWEATGAAPAVATSIPANRVVMPVVETVGSAGTVMFFMDYQEKYVG